MLRKLLTNTLLFGLAPYVPKVVSVFLMPVMTRYLTSTDYGIAGTIDAYTSALSTFATLEFGSVLSVVFLEQKIIIRFYGGKFMAPADMDGCVCCYSSGVTLFCYSSGG